MSDPVFKEMIKTTTKKKTTKKQISGFSHKTSANGFIVEVSLETGSLLCQQFIVAKQISPIKQDLLGYVGGGSFFLLSTRHAFSSRWL